MQKTKITKSINAKHRNKESYFDPLLPLPISHVILISAMFNLYVYEYDIII